VTQRACNWQYDAIGLRATISGCGHCLFFKWESTDRISNVWRWGPSERLREIIKSERSKHLGCCLSMLAIVIVQVGQCYVTNASRDLSKRRRIPRILVYDLPETALIVGPTMTLQNARKSSCLRETVTWGPLIEKFYRVNLYYIKTDKYFFDILVSSPYTASVTTKSCKRSQKFNRTHRTTRTASR